MKSSRTALISGASIAGPTLAYWLHQHGFVPTVIERSAQLRPGGYKIDLRGAAVEVARRMGILEDIQANEAGMETMYLVNSAGRRLGGIPSDLFMGRAGDDVEILRGELARIIVEKTAPVEYLFGDSIASLSEGPDGVHVTFENAPPRTFDLVVGADGLHSTVRALTFGDEHAFQHDLGHGVAIYSVPNHLALDRTELLYSAPGRTVSMYSTAGSADAKAMFLFPAPHGLPATAAAKRRVVTEHFSGAGWDTDRLLAAIDSAPDFYCDTITQVRMARWSRGRVVLVGDAAYAPSLASGQGTSLAMVGAYVLAHELGAARGSLDAALAAYEQRMHAFVDANQALGDEGISRMVAKGRFSCWLGNTMLRALPRLPWRNMVIQQMTGPIHDAANAIELPDPIRRCRTTAGASTPDRPVAPQE